MGTLQMKVVMLLRNGPMNMLKQKAYLHMKLPCDTSPRKRGGLQPDSETLLSFMGRLL